MPDDSSDSESKKIDEIAYKSSDDLSESNRLCRDSDDVDESE